MDSCITIQIFGTVCLDKIRIIENFPNVLGTYTEVKEERISLGGEASNSFVCASRWLIEESKSNQINEKKKKLKLISMPLVNDMYGRIIRDMKYFEEARVCGNIEIDLCIVEPSDDIRFTPSCDLYICSLKERTMFGIGFKESDKYMHMNQTKLIDERIEFLGENHWISCDYNTPDSSDYLIKKAVLSSTNMYIMDHSFSLNDFHHSHIDNIRKMNVIYQISTDFTSTQKDIPKTLEYMKEWLKEHPHCLMILTDGANGLGYGGEIYNSKSKSRETIDIQWIEPIKISDIKDTTGAGDCFRAGFLYQITEQRYLSSSNLLNMIRFASASGGLNCQSIGGCTNTPSLSSIRNLLSK